MRLIQGVDAIKIKVFEMRDSISIEYKKAEQERILAANERLKAQKEREILEKEREKQFIEDMKLSIFSLLLGLIPGVTSNDKFILTFKKFILRVPEEELDSANAPLIHKIVIAFILIVALIIVMGLIEYFS